MLKSEKSPEGISMDSTELGNELMAWIMAFNFPSTGRLSPVPNKASIMISSSLMSERHLWVKVLILFFLIFNLLER